ALPIWTQAQQLADLQAQLAVLEREVTKLDSVRSFAAETEREIAALERDLRDARTKLSQVTLERDNLEAEVRDARSDTDTGRRAANRPGDDLDVTARVDLAK